MAENKKSFILYRDQKGIFDKLNNDQAGLLIKHIFSYCSDENPESDFVTELAFESIKQTLKRDLERWDNKQSKNSEAGFNSAINKFKKRVKKLNFAETLELQNEIKLKIEKEGETKYLNQCLYLLQPISTDSTSVKSVEINSTDSTVSVNDSVSVSDNDIKEIKKVFNFRKSLIDYGFKKELVEDWLKVRKTKKATNTETAFNSFIKKLKQREGIEIDQLLEFMISKSWVGFEWSWIEKEEGNISKKGKIEKSLEDIELMRIAGKDLKFEA